MIGKNEEKELEGFGDKDNSFETILDLNTKDNISNSEENKKI